MEGAMNAPKILLLSQDTAQAPLLQDFLAGQGEVSLCTSPAEGFRGCRHGEVSLILVDESFSVAHSIWQQAAATFPWIPWIVLGRPHTPALPHLVNSVTVYRYVPWPWKEAEIRRCVQEGLHHAEQMQTLVAQSARLSLLYQTAATLHSFHDDYTTLLKVSTEKGKELLKAEACSIILLDEERQELFFPIFSDERLADQQSLAEIRFPAHEGLAGRALREGRSFLVTDVSQEPGFYPKVDEYTNLTTRSLLCVPLRTSRGNIGVIEVINKKEGEFTQEDLNFLEMLGTNVAVAIENARFYQTLLAENERYRAENIHLKRELQDRHRFEGIIGVSQNFLSVLEVVKQAAPTQAPALITGESGTGKELIAKALHYNSHRADKPFVVLNCAAIPRDLLESELFGHERGAFTGALNAKKGKFELADGGTLFLDEIGDLDLSLQAKLLRVLQTGEVQRLGSEHLKMVDVRIIAATNQNLKQMLEQGTFRPDLYYRLNVIPIHLPPLRERREDIPLLIHHFLQKLSPGKPVGIDAEATALLMRYDFPGNIRELENILHRAVILCRGRTITPAELPEEVKEIERSPLPFSPKVPETNEELKAAKALARQKASEEIERLFLLHILQKTRGNVSAAARLAGINRSWLQQMVSKFHIDVKAFR
ncbi:MAG: GAF domain-containing protein [Nitrospinota bacterium]|nr:MAG: GAF domain-containing protein [Nitrospinota bacterium]